ncbi:hypothetical protein A4G19_11340 [Pasteurellaceae bacterium Macca]|nr:hypothetical protein [Pasteurellaceae bacterium Macca]
MRKLCLIHDLPPHLPDGGVYLSHQPSQPLPIPTLPFNNAKSLLGQEFSYAIYDMRMERGVSLHLEALAILAGTILRNGTLFLLCADWQNLDAQPDGDSQRWNDGHLIPTPRFYAYFKALVAHFACPNTEIPPRHATPPTRPFTLTAEQQRILQQIAHNTEKIHLITAPRGRGKSTLAGQLAHELSKAHQVLLTARSKSVFTSFWRHIEEKAIPFIAPDELMQRIAQQQISPQQWLLIDEAASLPLPILNTFCHFFAGVILTTTTQNYEGTGRGFSLKFLPQLTRPARHWQLTQPLRWAENDPLEEFITQLLMLEGKTPLFRNIPPALQTLCHFYELLAEAHYKTTPSDLRRLFDGENQHLEPLHDKGALIGGLWAMREGGLDADLTKAIWRGERRPKGNLVPQYLCFQGNLPQACLLKSARISRIAITPAYQQQGKGKALVAQFLTTISTQVDFVSVSFGLTPPLFAFWQQCGFQLVQITPKAEASSGYPSAMMIRPTSPQGEAFTQQAVTQFERDRRFHPLAHDLTFIMSPNPVDHHFDEQDKRNINGFLHAQRTFSACYASFQRLYLTAPHTFAFLRNIPFSPSKAQIHQVKQKVALLPLPT